MSQYYTPQKKVWKIDSVVNKKDNLNNYGQYYYIKHKKEGDVFLIIFYPKAKKLTEFTKETEKASNKLRTIKTKFDSQ